MAKKEPLGEKNLRLIRIEAQKEIDSALDYTGFTIQHLHDGFVGFLLNPLLSLMFAWFGQNEAKQQARVQLDTTLKYGIQCRDKKSTKDIVENHFSEYMHRHILYVRARRDHALYPKVELLLKENFRTRLEFIGGLLHASGNSYDALLRHAFTEGKALYYMEKQFDVVEKVIDCVREDPELLKIPALVQKDILKVISKSIRHEREQLQKRVHEIYRQ